MVVYNVKLNAAPPSPFQPAGTRGIDYLFGVILAVVVANWVAHHLHAEGVYESELERIGNVYMLRDEPPHRLHTLTAEAIMATGVFSFRWGQHYK